jgi:hypothetical protein
MPPATGNLAALTINRGALQTKHTGRPGGPQGKAKRGLSIMIKLAFIGGFEQGAVFGFGLELTTADKLPFV